MINFFRQPVFCTTVKGSVNATAIFSLMGIVSSFSQLLHQIFICDESERDKFCAQQNLRGHIDYCALLIALDFG